MEGIVSDIQAILVEAERRLRVDADPLRSVVQTPEQKQAWRAVYSSAVRLQSAILMLEQYTGVNQADPMNLMVAPGELVTPPLLEWLESVGYHDAAELVRQRDAYRRAKYGQGLMPGDGCDPIEDARQELGDVLQHVQKAREHGLPLNRIRPVVAALNALMDHAPGVGNMVDPMAPYTPYTPADFARDELSRPDLWDGAKTEVIPNSWTVSAVDHGDAVEELPAPIPGPWLTEWPENMPEGSWWEWETDGESDFHVCKNGLLSEWDRTSFGGGNDRIRRLYHLPTVTPPTGWEWAGEWRYNHGFPGWERQCEGDLVEVENRGHFILSGGLCRPVRRVSDPDHIDPSTWPKLMDVLDTLPAVQEESIDDPEVDSSDYLLRDGVYRRIERVSDPDPDNC